MRKHRTRDPRECVFRFSKFCVLFSRLQQQIPCSRVLQTLSTSAKMGTVELTGLEMIRKHALGQLLAHCSAIPFTIDAFVLNKSSLRMVNNNNNGHESRTRKV